MDTMGLQGINSPEGGKMVLIALGSNQSTGVGGPKETILKAIELVKEKGLVIRKLSQLYVTPAFPLGAGPDYANAALEVSANLDPVYILGLLHEVEAELGRERSIRWGARTVDLDLLACGALICPDPETQGYWRMLALEEQMKRAPEQLILPHPRLQDRAFVLVPLADIAPDWVHPVLGASVRQMLEALPKEDKDSVRLAE